MISFHRVSTPKDEIAYLKRVNEYNTHLRDKYDHEFLKENNLQARYEKIFTPITRPLNKSLQAAATAAGTPPPPLSPPTSTSTPYVEKKKKRKSFIDDDDGDDDSFLDEETHNYDDDDDGMNITKYFTKKKSGRYGNNDDGIPHDDYFGIKKTLGAKKKGGYTFLGKYIRFEGGRQTHRTGFIVTDTGQHIVIPSRRIWDMILLKYLSFSPTQQNLADYGKVLKDVGFPQWFEKLKNTSKKHEMKQSEKYRELIEPALIATDVKQQQHSGTGITRYTRKSPLYYHNKNRKSNSSGGGGLQRNIIEFFPANKKALLKKLVYLLGEYRSGNTTALRNEIVPIIQYLKSIGVPIPKSKRRNKNKNNLNWLYD